MAAYRAAVRVNNPQESADVHLNVYHSSLTLLMAYALGWPCGTDDPSDVPGTAGASSRTSYDPEAAATTGNGPGSADINRHRDRDR